MVTQLNGYGACRGRFSCAFLGFWVQLSAGHGIQLSISLIFQCIQLASQDLFASLQYAYILESSCIANCKNALLFSNVSVLQVCRAFPAELAVLAV